MFFERARDLFSTFLIFQIVQGVTGYGWGGGQIIFRTGTHPPFSVCTNPEQVYSKFKHMDLKSQYFPCLPNSNLELTPPFLFAQTQKRWASTKMWISNHSTSCTHFLLDWNSSPLFCLHKTKIGAQQAQRLGSQITVLYVPAYFVLERTPHFSVRTNQKQVYSKFKHVDIKPQYFTYPPT